MIVRKTYNIMYNRAKRKGSDLTIQTGKNVGKRHSVACIVIALYRIAKYNYSTDLTRRCYNTIDDHKKSLCEVGEIES